MRKRMTAGKVAILAVALGFSACRKEANPKDAVREIPPPSGDTNFTPPEIRRPAPSADTAQTKSGHDSAKSAKDTATRIPSPAIAPKPVPVAVVPAAPAPKPAAPAPAPPVAKVEPPKPAPTKHAPAPVPKSSAPGDPGADGDWVLQVNVHKSEADAKAQIASLAAQGIPAYAIPVPTEGTGLAGQYWRVRVGHFKSRADAQAYGEKRIAAFAPKFWIDRKSNETHSGGTP